MTIRMTPLKTVLLFIPFIVTAIIGRIQNPGLQSFLDSYNIFNHLATLNVLLITAFQAYFFIRFNVVAVKRFTFFIINGLLPVIYSGYQFIQGIFSTLNRPHFLKLGKPEGPMPIVALGLYDMLMVFLLVYSL
ncbi:hypothetical protein HYN43_019560 [Mucilaginibacter celer]|uniref:Uncharacterized protein n=1 Tax=Mucilaginibacter celer TaxID=2305508 RepID=A0A494W1E6_9SPHI|nr:hypothetical protein HYN43_019560 [Mucilaginibacter celer]